MEIVTVVVLEAAEEEEEVGEAPLEGRTGPYLHLGEAVRSRRLAQDQNHLTTNQNFQRYFNFQVSIASCTIYSHTGNFCCKNIFIVDGSYENLIIL